MTTTNTQGDVRIVMSAEDAHKAALLALQRKFDAHKVRVTK